MLDLLAHTCMVIVPMIIFYLAISGYKVVHRSKYKLLTELDSCTDSLYCQAARSDDCQDRRCRYHCGIYCHCEDTNRLSHDEIAMIRESRRFTHQERN